MSRLFSSESEVVQTFDYLSSAALGKTGLHSDYVASAAHYESVARGILANLRSSNRPFVLVTGDPPPDPVALSEALGKVAEAGYAAIIIPCRPELKRDDLDRTLSRPAKPKAANGAGDQSGHSARASELFIFDDFDQLSDTHIKSVCEIHDQNLRAAVLLAPSDFLARLERPALRFLNDRIAAQFRFQELGDNEAIAFLHNQLLSQQDRRVEARGFRRGMLVGFALGGAALAASITALILHPISEQIPKATANTSQKRLVEHEKLMIRPAEEDAMTRAASIVESYPVIVAGPPAPTAPTAPTKMEDPPTAAVPSGEHPPAAPRLSDSEIAALLSRGDALLGTGDVTSARLFYEHVYERSADAESGLAALRLGATFDPIFASRGGARTTIDPAQALLWYRRAHQLGVGEAAHRIERLDPGVTPDRRAR